jgi:hypothetical protein
MGLLETYEATVTNPLSQTPSINYASDTDYSKLNVGNFKLLDASSYAKSKDFYADMPGGTANWKDELQNLADIKFDRQRNFTEPQSQADNSINAATQRERDRITSQKQSHSYQRKDSFAIGTVYLNIPPTQISISEEKHNYKFRPLRNEADIIASSGRSTTRIDLEVTFSGFDDINNKLRPLIAQFKCTPFLPIDNEYIRSILNPEDKSVSTDLDSAKQDLDRLNKMKAESAKLDALSDDNRTE